MWRVKVAQWPLRHDAGRINLSHAHVIATFQGNGTLTIVSHTLGKPFYLFPCNVPSVLCLFPCNILYFLISSAIPSGSCSSVVHTEGGSISRTSISMFRPANWANVLDVCGSKIKNTASLSPQVNVCAPEALCLCVSVPESNTRGRLITFFPFSPSCSNV